VLSPSPTRHHELAVHTIRRGHYASLFWGLAIAGGGILPLAAILVLGGSAPAVAIVAIALLALAGSAAWEYIWVEAGQSVPLS
jgi:VIT1/CCC1 family predicted Fe2+/Mn2+ transporter